MLHDIVFFLLGLALVICGGNYVTSGASGIARRFNMSSLLIGVTVVAFGSSLPDLVVCLGSTLKGHSELALGDVVGSNIIDILLVTGVVAAISPVSADWITRRFDMPMLALSCLVVFICGDDILIDRASLNSIDRSDGLLLLCFFAVYMSFSIYLCSGGKGRPAPSAAQASSGGTDAQGGRPLWILALMVAGGLAALIVGGDWFVDGASGIAVRAGMSEGLVGLTIVSIGGAAPDIATSVIATLRKEQGIAMGNIFGACIINVFLILGTCAVVSPLDVSTIKMIDFGTLALGGVAVWLVCAFRGRIGRPVGIVLILAYFAYLASLVADFLMRR